MPAIVPVLDNPVSLRILEIVLGAKRLLTYREIIAKVPLSQNGLKYHLDRLKAAGFVTYELKKARTLRPTCRWIPAEQLDQQPSKETEHASDPRQ